MSRTGVTNFFYKVTRPLRVYKNTQWAVYKNTQWATFGPQTVVGPIPGLEHRVRKC